MGVTWGFDNVQVTVDYGKHDVTLEFIFQIFELLEIVKNHKITRFL